VTTRDSSDVDRQLLTLLREDARRNVSELAAALGVSRSSIYSSIDRLERAGTIAGYTVRLGDAYEQRLVRAHVMIKVVPKSAASTIDQLAALAEIVSLHAIAGEYDLIAMVAAPDLGHLNDLLDGIGALDGVERTNSSVILATKVQR
jgi:DNA-binding Lrp family transcriptional regulator